MDVRIVNQSLSQIQADVLVLPLFEGGVAAAADDVKVVLSQAGEDFTGEFGQTLVLYTAGQIAARKVLALGLGKADKLDTRKVRRAAGMAARAARETAAKSVAFAVPVVAGLEAATVAQFMVEGAIHGLFRFESYKSEKKEKPQVETILVAGGPEIEAGVTYGRIVAEAANVTRNINWMPGNHLTASKLATLAKEICEEVGVEIEVYDKQGCEQLGLGLLLAVNQGSTEEPRFIVMRYKGNGGQGPWLGIVGKGLTFDSGGISIKPSDGMWDMKYDMSGGGAVLGAVKAIGQLKPKADILFVVPATDNMPDGGAYKPGDVIVGLSGKTVEIRSTDAEGRLILADGLAYAVNQGCTKLIEASTLTGAAQIALGPVRMGIVSNNDAWENEVYTAIEEAGERGWKLPHDPEYYEFFKSPIADMSNTGTARAAGTTVGGLFLMSHVGDVPCVHLDIASQAWKNSTDKVEDEGATGVAVRSFVKAAMRFAEGNR
ncbi:MAG TPA: leucyl aminopeptidase [Symbiobacteriaceae bacterium]|nr:leucyl aminopeptidase [Symbiobacteriaceae bacterium]